MKNLIIILLLISKIGFSQNLVFTDQNLKNYLLNQICVDNNNDELSDVLLNTNNDNEIQLSEAQSIENLVIDQTELTINSLADLHQFTNLKRLSIWGGFNITEISNLNINGLEHIRISDFNSITNIDLSDLPNLNSIIIEGLNGLDNLNIQNESYASTYFSLFYTYFNTACVDNITDEYNTVAAHLLNGALPTINCNLNTTKQTNNLFSIHINSLNELVINTDLIVSNICIYNTLGQRVFKSIDHNKIININPLKKGVFIVSIMLNNHKIIKQKIIIE